MGAFSIALLYIVIVKIRRGDIVMTKEEMIDYLVEKFNQDRKMLENLSYTELKDLYDDFIKDAKNCDFSDGPYLIDISAQ